jgi:hypothetical protein
MSPDALSNTQFNALQDHQNLGNASFMSVSQNIGHKIYEKGVRRVEAKAKQMEQLRQL